MSTASKRLLSAAALGALLLAACQPKTAETPPETAAAAPAQAASGCNTHVERDWINEETPLRRYTVEAQAIGPTCEQAVLVLIIRAREGSPIYTWAGRAEDLALNKYTTDPSTKAQLTDWISGSGGHSKTSSLPAWEETEGQPKRSEFPFMPEEWIDKTYWDKLKSENLDMFCFVQGGESMKCAVLRDGQMEEVGLQLFPG